MYIGEYVDNKKKDLVYISGLMENGMMVSGKTENSMELASISNHQIDCGTERGLMARRMLLSRKIII